MTRQHITLGILLIATIAAMLSCNKEKDASDVQDEAIEKFMKSRKDSIFVDGCYLYITKEGDTAAANQYTRNDTVKMVYTGYTLQKNRTFAKNTEVKFSYQNCTLLEPFRHALPYFKKGGSYTLLVPYEYGYGKQRMGVIEPYSTLVFTFTTN